MELSGGRKYTVPTPRSINFTIDDVNAANHEAIRQIQCGGNFLAWYRLYDSPVAFGGTSGIKGYIDADMVIPREKAGQMTYEGTMSWTSRFSEEMFMHPMA